MGKETINPLDKSPCKYIHHNLKDIGKCSCMRGGPDSIKKAPKCLAEAEWKTIKASECETCLLYENAYILFPISVSSIKYNDIRPYGMDKIGTPCRIRLAEKDSDKTTYLGFYLGELPYIPTSFFDKKVKQLTFSVINNPAIYVPDLGRIVFGAESWWSFIDREEYSNIPDITDGAINKQWYVQMLKDLCIKSDVINLKGED